MTTFLELQTETQATGPFDTTTASSGRIKLWLNQSQNWFLSKRRWSFLEASATVASVSGQADYVVNGTSAIVTDFSQLISVSHNQANAGTTYIKLTYLPQQEFENMLGAAGATPGIPIFYTLRGGVVQTTSATILASGNQKLSLWPVPNFIGSLRMQFFRSVASCKMTADTDISIVPEEWQPALIFRAAGYGLKTKGAVLQGQGLMADAEELASQAVAADSVARRGDLAPEDQPVLPPNLPANPAAGANPANSPYGVREA